MTEWQQITCREFDKIYSRTVLRVAASDTDVMGVRNGQPRIETIWARYNHGDPILRAVRYPHRVGEGPIGGDAKPCEHWKAAEVPK